LSSSSSGIEITEIEKAVASDAQDGDGLGISVAISGDYAVAGSNQSSGAGGNGAAYIFHRTNPTTWDSGTKIVASDGESADRFGNSVSISGDYVIAGAPFEAAGGTNAGAAYIFQRTGTNTWDTGVKIVAADAQTADLFGYSVAISGDYAVVGAYGEDAGGSSAGAAYIFHRTGTNTWDTGTKIVASDAAAGDYFGISVAISGDYAAIGAFAEDAGGSNAGAAYIFHRTGTNTWDTGTKIVASDAAAGDYFGISVGISGDYAVVGAYRETAGGTDSGAAYIFNRTGTNTWDAGIKIVASDAQEGDYFGNSVSISGDYVIAGAPFEDAGGSDAGAAYIFHRTGTNTWDTGLKFTGSDVAAGHYFGYSAAINSDDIFIGAIEDPGAGVSRGAAYIFAIS
jgi:hypothetical protein